MTKAILLVYRRPDLEPAAFQAYWKDVHGPIGAKIPGLRAYIQRYAVATPDGPPAVDGFAEAHFDSPDALQAGLASPEGQAAVADLANFVDMSRWSLVMVEDQTIV